MIVPVELSEETLLQLSELYARDGCPGRTDTQLLSDLIRNMVDLTHETFVVDDAEESRIKLVK